MAQHRPKRGVYESITCSTRASEESRIAHSLRSSHFTRYHARLALRAGDEGEFAQCQAQLVPLHAAGLSEHAAEFAAYRILHCAASRAASLPRTSSAATSHLLPLAPCFTQAPSLPDELRTVARGLAPPELAAPPVAQAIAVVTALQRGDAAAFFREAGRMHNRGDALVAPLVEQQRAALDAEFTSTPSQLAPEHTRAHAEPWQSRGAPSIARDRTPALSSLCAHLRSPPGARARCASSAPPSSRRRPPRSRPSRSGSPPPPSASGTTPPRATRGSRARPRVSS